MKPSHKGLEDRSLWQWREGKVADIAGTAREGNRMAVTKIRMRMLEDGRPQYKIAADIGIPPSRLSEYALGQRAIPTHRIYDFVRLWNCDVSDILGFEDDDGINDTG